MEKEEEKTMTLDVRFWGVRGSVPTPGPTTAAVGGNTSCVELRYNDEILILDGGTGLRALGEHLMLTSRPVSATILFSHIHWDHIQGFPFFAPLFCEDSSLRIFGLSGDNSIEEALRRQMTDPSFPVQLEQLTAKLKYNPIVERGFRCGSFHITAAPLCHPNGVFGFRIEAGGRTIVYATDTEHNPNGILDKTLVQLASNADILIYDSQYTEDEYNGTVGLCRHGWGHSTWNEGVRIAQAANVGQLVLFHHDPSHDDQTVAEIEAAAQKLLPETVAAKEGLHLQLHANLDYKAA